MTDTLASRPPSLPVLRRLDRGVIGLALTALAAGTVLLAQTVGLRHALLLPIGGAMGLTLYHAAFGFTGGWRRFVLEGRGAAIRAQMLMVALAAVVILPMLAHGTAFGRPLAGAIAPVGVSVLVGAALFGFGMQLGGGCGSGTLFTVGGGSGRMVVTLVFFCIGALIGTAHLGWWMRLPSLGAIGLGRSLGTGGAIALTLAGLAAVAAATAWIERRRHGSLERAGPAPRHGLARFTHGPWPLLAAAVALAALNIATLATAGHTWSITYGFGLWAAKGAQAVGIDVASWPFWTTAFSARALGRPLWFDTTSVMNFGILLGAALAAGLAGRFAPRVDLSARSLAAAVIGGLLMGYGARLGFGCNIGALFSGIASGSVHGWLWFAAAFAGSWAGVRARPLFGLA